MKSSLPFLSFKLVTVLSFRSVAAVFVPSLSVSRPPPHVSGSSPRRVTRFDSTRLRQSRLNWCGRRYAWRFARHAPLYSYAAREKKSLFLCNGRLFLSLARPGIVIALNPETASCLQSKKWISRVRSSKKNCIETRRTRKTSPCRKHVGIRAIKGVSIRSRRETLFVLRRSIFSRSVILDVKYTRSEITCIFRSAEWSDILTNRDDYCGSRSEHEWYRGKIVGKIDRTVRAYTNDSRQWKKRLFYVEQYVRRSDKSIVTHRRREKEEFE